MGMPIRKRPRPDLADAHNHLKAVIEDRRALMDRLTCRGCSRDVAHVLGALIAACVILAEMVKQQNSRLPTDMQIPIEDPLSFDPSMFDPEPDDSGH